MCRSRALAEKWPSRKDMLTAGVWGTLIEMRRSMRDEGGEWEYVSVFWLPVSKRGLASRVGGSPNR